MELKQIVITVHDRVGVGQRLSVPPGANLREVLLRKGLTPYTKFFKSMNCKGMGVCGSCRVAVRDNGTAWLRRSCQIRCFQDLEIELQ